MSAIRLPDAVAVLPYAALGKLPPARLEVRQRRLLSAVIGILAALIAIAAVANLFASIGNERPIWIPLLAALWFGGFGTLIGWLCLHSAFSAGGPGGWVLREDGAHLLVNLRSHRNMHFDPATPSVLVLPQRKVRSMSVIRERGIQTHVGDTGLVFENPIRREFLDIVFDGDVEAVTAALTAEGVRRGETGLGSSRHNHSSVRMLPNGTLRVAWRDETNRLRPGLNVLRRRIGARYRFIEAESSAQTPLQSLDRSGQESRLLEMATRGERIEAIALAKVLYGMDTTEAVQFVESLRS